MKNRLVKITAFVMSANMAFSWAATPVFAEEDAADAGEIGTIAFAQCDSYINIRSSADVDSEVTGKLFNNCAVTIVGKEGDWYQITSGNASGYVSAEYFATGEEADAIADKVAYNVAQVHPEVLNVRSAPSEDSEVVDVATQSEELEVVDWNGDWMTVAINSDTYGYINAYYVDYKTYYPVGVTLEEEQDRLASIQAASAQTSETTETTAQTEPVNTQPETEAPAEEPVYTDGGYVETEAQYTEGGYVETEPQYTEGGYVETEAPYTEPEYVETDYVETEPQYTETDYVETEPEYVETEAPYTEPEYVETEPEYVETEPEYVETEAPYTEPEYVETEPEYVETEPSYSDLGQQIANYAVQFVGNPYVYGGTSLTNGADCSGFTQSVMANFGIYISRTAADQSYGGTAVDISNLQPGDLVFYADGGYVGHVALYIGGGQIVHASTEETGIIISNYDYQTPYCARRYW
ncbi:NlpC/P60 family protein [Marvinbryantia formatexigens DSM 14469]|uniref:NlpC/P60 family protein n=1 Tax=Marvinbryantia formatexigens DSM 14469 TaxID=478749 RepID=C6LIB9_9FIRM|nr:C40 family peptidase [Marvinbryantia formatexigens]EET59615.1 NlpC/P60 family protein [Marvinbryantia formatexigens DSM 14469]UWO26278.1 NlpC/P60 family protein [Marvinbryantia formatexigens DSM 14469]SDG09683.1 SH3 domain-containing protein [Marvinbryantia formatexigens]